MKRYVIGTDIGTTSTKSVLFTLTGEVVNTSLLEYPLCSPDPDTAEQDPEEILQAVLRTVGQVTKQIQPDEVLCLSLSSAMHSLIAVNADGDPLTKSITWADNRSAAWADVIKQKHQGHQIYRRTGTPIHPMSPLVKLLWLRHEQPQIFQQATKFISIKDYVLHHLFQCYVMDHSIASATGLLNLERLQWDETALEVAGIRAEQLPELVPTTYVLQPMAAEFARLMGLAPDTPVVVGASDGVLSNLGVGAMQPGVVATTIGTSGAIRAVVDRPVTDPQGRLFCYALTEQHWVVGGAVNNGGIILRWLRDQFGDAEIMVAHRLGEDPYELLADLAATVPPGADGLIFHPYLLGERAPLWDANARGSFFGLTINHGKAHLARAVLEGILFNLLVVLRAVEDFTGKTKQIQATGGFARSLLWRQMMADVFNQPITIPKQHESSCLGAAILGLYALKQIDNLDASPMMIGATHQHQPNPADAAIYQKIMPLYTKLLDQFRSHYQTIANLQAELHRMQ